MDSMHGSQGSGERRERAGSSASRPLQGAAEEARRTAQSLGDTGLRWVDEFFESRREAAVEGLCGIASALRTTARALHEQQQPRVSDWATAAAQRVDTLCDSLRESDLRALLERAQVLARRQPALLLGGALAVGFLCARFLKSSEHADSGAPFAESDPTVDTPAQPVPPTTH
jgi:hypothetical protein